MNKKTIIITGGFGTIGFALSTSLLKQGHRVINVDTRVNKTNKLRDNNDNLFVIKANLNKENDL